MLSAPARRKALLPAHHRAPPRRRAPACELGGLRVSPDPPPHLLSRLQPPQQPQRFHLRSPAPRRHWLAKNASLICAHLCAPPPSASSSSSVLTFLLSAAPARSGGTRWRRRRRSLSSPGKSSGLEAGSPTSRLAPRRRGWCRARLPPGRRSGPWLQGGERGFQSGGACVRWAQRLTGENWTVTCREVSARPGVLCKRRGSRASPG